MCAALVPWAGALSDPGPRYESGILPAQLVVLTRNTIRGAGITPRPRHVPLPPPRIASEGFVPAGPTGRIDRRNLTPGQRAMAVAMLRPKPEQGKRTDLSISGHVSDILRQRLSDAPAAFEVEGEDREPDADAEPDHDKEADHDNEPSVC